MNTSPRVSKNLHYDPWVYSKTCSLLMLGIVVVWLFLLPAATPVGGKLPLIHTLSLYGISIFSVLGGVIFLSNKRHDKRLAALVAIAMLLFWVWLFIRYSGADWSRLVYVFFNFEIIGRSGLEDLLSGLGVTVMVGIIGTICAFSLGVFLTLLRFLENKVISGFVTAYVDIFRALPTIVLVSLIHYGAPFVGIYLPLMVSGILTLTLNHSAFFSEILRGGVNAIGTGQLEASRSLGLNVFKTFRLIVFPQAFKLTLPPLTGQLVALLKETVICSVVGIPELLREALVVQSWTANPTPLILATIGYLILLLPLTRFSRHLEQRLSVVRKPAQ